MRCQRPARLHPGDVVAVLSPSWGGPSLFPAVHDRGLEVLRRVNHRRLNHQLGQHLPGAGYVENEAELEALLASKEGWWLFKRALGYAGR